MRTFLLDISFALKRGKVNRPLVGYSFSQPCDTKKVQLITPLNRFDHTGPFAKHLGIVIYFNPPKKRQKINKDNFCSSSPFFPSVLLPRCFRSLRCRSHRSPPWRLDLPPWRKPLPRRHHGCRRRNGSSFGGQAQMRLRSFDAVIPPKKLTNIPWKFVLKWYLFWGHVHFWCSNAWVVSQFRFFAFFCSEIPN